MLALAAALVVLTWVVQLALVLRIVRAVPPVASLPAPPPDTRWPRLTMIVPARNEAHGIEAAIQSKLGCGYPDLEIVAIDDRSEDATGAILDAAAARDPRVKVAHVAALPEGWLGKLNAMKHGLSLATGEWVLFSDADVHLAPGLLDAMIAHAERERIDLLAVFPQMRPVSTVLDAGVVGLIRLILLPARAWACNDDRSGVALGVGAFNLVRREALVRAQAIEALRMEIADDVALAALVKHHGGRCRAWVGRDRVNLVFLDSFQSALRSAGKAGGMFGWSPLAALGALAPVVIDLVVPVLAIARGSTVAAPLGALALLLATVTHLVLAWHLAAPLKGALLWPLGHVMNGGVMAFVAIRAWRAQGVWWRGTFYSRAVIDAGRRLALPSMRIRS